MVEAEKLDKIVIHRRNKIELVDYPLVEYNVCRGSHIENLIGEKRNA